MTDNALIAIVGKSGLPVRRWMVEDMQTHGYSGTEVFAAVRALDDWLNTGDLSGFSTAAARLYALMVQDAIEGGLEPQESA